jgi:hypothetical protein
MLHVPVEMVRLAVDHLSTKGELTAESFLFMDRNWRVAPSDIKRIQEWIVAGVDSGNIAFVPPKRRVKRKQIIEGSEEETSK